MRFDGDVMVGISGGTLDRLVLGWAAEEADARHADLLVCHVRERWEPRRPHAGELEPAGSAELLVREAANTARTWFPDLLVTTAVGHDRVASALVRASVDARMVVLGARRNGGSARLGSVADEVATHAQCPVAVFRPPSVPDLADVVVGLDGSSHSEVTLRLAASEARRFGGRLIVVNAYRLPAPVEYGRVLRHAPCAVVVAGCEFPRKRAMQRQGRTRSSTLRRLTAAAARAGIDADEREKLVGVVLAELAVRVTPTQWCELCGWLPWDVRFLAGPRHAGRSAPREDLVAAVAVATGLPRPVTVVAVRMVVGELGRIVPASTVPARLASGAPGL
jgi:nucleotide-binding universal stress UspA family protein